ncbi:DUF257 family protein [Thermococcus sp. MAR1]|uniref:DUF257 family protein n=1 Tax=Thermococcus sp. MAR1 TaxID=1638263 RepID=UPI00143C4D84|nr:DUF257 family protein [Thermococcus sp. MAR1]NJE11034.1 hypothetical protein [Thermococcus sp. MAR1]
MTGLLSQLPRIKEGIVLVEYSSTDHPERAMAKIFMEWMNLGIIPLIVDIGDALHVFIQNLRFQGIELPIENVPVIKEKGTVKVGNVVGNVDVVDDFDHHLAIYAKFAKEVPLESRNHTIVLGMERFSFTFMSDPPKLERYFEKITRLYLPVEGRTSFLFLNTDIASDYLRKGLEQDSDYVVEVEGRNARLLKSPGGVGYEIL